MGQGDVAQIDVATEKSQPVHALYVINGSRVAGAMTCVRPPAAINELGCGLNAVADSLAISHKDPLPERPSATGSVMRRRLSLIDHPAGGDAPRRPASCPPGPVAGDPASAVACRTRTHQLRPYPPSTEE